MNKVNTCQLFYVVDYALAFSHKNIDVRHPKYSGDIHILLMLD